MRYGRGDNGELTFLDILGVMSFLIGVENLGMNLTQDDKQELQEDLSNKANQLLAEIHSHLESQDAKLDLLLSRLENKK